MVLWCPYPNVLVLLARLGSHHTSSCTCPTETTLQANNNHIKNINNHVNTTNESNIKDIHIWNNILAVSVAASVSSIGFTKYIFLNILRYYKNPFPKRQCSDKPEQLSISRSCRDRPFWELVSCEPSGAPLPGTSLFQSCSPSRKESWSLPASLPALCSLIIGQGSVYMSIQSLDSFSQCNNTSLTNQCIIPINQWLVLCFMQQKRYLFHCPIFLSCPKFSDCTFLWESWATNRLDAIYFLDFGMLKSYRTQTF